MSRLLRTTSITLAVMIAAGILSPLHVKAVEAAEDVEVVPVEEPGISTDDFNPEEEASEIVVKELVSVVESRDEVIQNNIAFVNDTPMNVSGRINASTLKKNGANENTILICTGDLTITMDEDLDIHGIIASNQSHPSYPIPSGSDQYNVTIRSSGGKLFLGNDKDFGFINAKVLTLDGGIVESNQFAKRYHDLPYHRVIIYSKSTQIKSGIMRGECIVESIDSFNMEGGQLDGGNIISHSINITSAKIINDSWLIGNTTVIKNSEFSANPYIFGTITLVNTCTGNIKAISAGEGLTISNSNLQISMYVRLSTDYKKPSGSISIDGEITNSFGTPLEKELWSNTIEDLSGELVTTYSVGYRINAEGSDYIVIKRNSNTQKGWIKSSNGKWWYRNADGSYPKDQWKKIDGKWYYFDKSGWMMTGWVQVKNKWYYLNSNGAMQTGWLKSGGKWYYLDDSGVMMKGWQKVGGKWYYMNRSGVMQTGWILVGKNYYYLDSSGAMKTGWHKSGSNWYYFDSSGLMAKYWTFINGKWYYFDESGAMKTGWIKPSKSWYYLNSSGVMQTGWLTYNGNLYYLMENGAMVANKTLTIDGVKYTFNAKGIVVSQSGTPQPDTQSDGSSTTVGSLLPNQKGATGEDVIKQAEKYIGTPYAQMDCSHFTHRVLNDLGVKMPTTGSKEQISYGIHLDSAVASYKATGDLTGFKEGDILFYCYDTETSSPSGDHVAFYAGDGKVIHATSSKGVRYTAFNAGWTGGKLDTFLFAARRVVN